jgi:integrase
MRLFKTTYTTPGCDKKTARKWYLDFYHNGRRHKLPGLIDRRQTESLGGKIQELINLKAGGMTPGTDLQRWIDTLPPQILSKLVEWQIITSQRAASAVLLKDHLKRFREYLESKGDTPAYCRKGHTRIETVLDGCKFSVLSDVSASRIQKFLADEIQSKHIGRKTANHYIGMLKTFFRWMKQDGQSHINPLEYISLLDTAQDEPRQRRALTADEMRTLLSVTAGGPVRRGITGAERVMHYETAAMTGLRAKELRALKVSDFDFEANVVHLAAKFTKNRREAVLPLKPEFAERVKIFLAGKLPDCPVFKTPASGHEVRVLRQDLQAADIPEIDDAGRVFDFHSFRVFYASMLAYNGTNPKTAMELMRHSDIRLTMNIYSHAYKESLTAAVDALPNLGVRKNLSVSLSECSNQNTIISDCSGQIVNSQNTAKQPIQCKITHSCNQKQSPAEAGLHWRRGDSNPSLKITKPL